MDLDTEGRFADLRRIPDLNRLLEKDLRVNLDLTDAERRNVAVTIAIRNSIVHSGGVITERFIREVGPDSGFAAGEQLEVDLHGALESQGQLQEVGFKLADQVISTFYPRWPGWEAAMKLAKEADPGETASEERTKLFEELMTRGPKRPLVLDCVPR